MNRISFLSLMICAAFALGQVSSHAAIISVDPTYETTYNSRPVNYTGELFDLAITGDAFFRVRDSKTGEIFATRFGRFRIDVEGYLVLFENLRLQGFNKPIRYDSEYSATDPVGDIRFDSILPEGLPASAAGSQLSQVIIGSLGTITCVLSDGTAYIRGRIFLQEFERSENLRQKWQYFYTNLDAAKPVPPTVSTVSSGVLDAGFPRAWSGILLDNTEGLTTVWVTYGLVGRNELEASSDLLNWRPFATNRINWSDLRPDSFDGAFKFVDAASTNSANRFYRVTGPVVKQTGKETDLAISGEGYFVLRDPASGSTYVTRAGNFHLDGEKFLTNEQGMRVQGYNSSITMDSEYPAASEIGDIKLDKGTVPQPGSPSGQIANLSIDSNGRINILLSNGTQYRRGQILLQDFTNPFALKQRDGFLFSYDATAGPLPQPSKPTYADVGHIEPGALEFSRHTPFR